MRVKFFQSVRWVARSDVQFYCGNAANLVEIIRSPSMTGSGLGFAEVPRRAKSSISWTPDQT